MSDLKLSVGALLVSGWMSFMSFGLVLAFGWQYFLQFYNDRVLYKTIVTTCLLLCLGDTIVSGMYMQFLTVDCPSPNITPDIQDYGVIGGRRPILVGGHSYIVVFPYSDVPRTNLVCEPDMDDFDEKKCAASSADSTTIFRILGSHLAIALWMFSKLIKHHSTLVDDSKLVFPVGYGWLGTLRICAFLVASLTTPKFDPGSNESIISSHQILSDMTIAKVYTFSLLVSLNARTPIVEAISHAAVTGQQRDPITFTRSTINATAVQVRQDVHVVHDDSDAGPISPYDKIEMENESEYEVGKDGAVVECSVEVDKFLLHL
ncbi:hypothetical protein EV368DRAFT_62941 [Lentinula lateritia]|uniref:Uncharacterized protein n=1 Tax=Lentinula aff. lateritia TaxID=2804960 RepID=A0ACC1UCJ1_9AGAR|nr:hypothetical protein F5876DRAFT_62424 [Lentinula aff. lateritia]KAJ3854815.1 hypothetical protein EV368DRAFT_62941 [Lentinula lateritia]